MSSFPIRVATAEEHKEIYAVAKLSKYTKDFSNQMMFSSEAAYEKGWIRVATSATNSRIVGFTCVRHKRNGKTMLYFIGVDPNFAGLGIGRDLLEDVMAHGPHKIMELNVMKDNEAVNFYLKLGFKIVGEAMNGQAHRLEKEWE